MPTIEIQGNYSRAPWNISQNNIAGDLRVVQGQTWTTTITLTDENDVAIDLTGYTAKMEIRDKPGGQLYLSLTPTVTAATGTITMTITAAQSVLFTFTHAAYDLKITAGAVVTVLMGGDFDVIPRVSQ